MAGAAQSQLRGQGMSPGQQINKVITVQSAFDEAANAIEVLRSEITMLDERLGYVSTPQLEQNGIESSEPPSLPCSPCAHNFNCLTADINRLSFRVQAIRANLEV